ncbi:cysteine--tRNA ligase [bacterium]|nr:cysteine--tRNA ligase [bacterium]
MPLRITNTLSGKKEDFVPLRAGEASLYTCGPTVYGLTHIGNARPPVFFDVVRRFLKVSGFKTTWVMNFTDVDDKIINRAREEKTTSDAIAQKFTQAYLEDLASLGVQLPDKQPKVTQYIPQIIQLVERLVANNAAYVAENGEVFFSVRGFAKYGQLSNKKIDDLLAGVRIAADEKKRDPLDFSLWKPRKTEDEPSWDSPWGKGRPGWHIECSAMAVSILGETFDIHGGGLDLVHPHHENEIAQSEAATGKIFARYWMHNNLISMDREKMSKSLGNIFLTRDFIAKYTAEALRYLLLSVHYRSPAEYSKTHVREVQAALHRVYSAKARAQAWAETTQTASLPEIPEEKTLAELGAGFEKGWFEAMSDDFNTPKALAFVFDYVRAANAYFDKKGLKPSVRTVQLAQEFLAKIDGFSQTLNLFGSDAQAYLGQLRLTVLQDRGIDPATIDAALAARQKARAEKNFAEADALRLKLSQQGIEIKDTPRGTEWDVAFTVSNP